MEPGKEILGGRSSPTVPAITASVLLKINRNGDIVGVRECDEVRNDEGGYGPFTAAGGDIRF